MLSDLSVTPIAQTLHRIAAERRCGDLQVRTGKLVKTVFFDQGRVVFAASNLKKDRLGEALVAMGRISEVDFERASSLARDQKRRFGDALVEAGILEKEEIGRSVAKQVRRIVVSLFTLDEGVGLFEDRECPVPLEFMVSLSIHRILYEGIRSMKSEELIQKCVGDLDRWVERVPVPPFAYDIDNSPKEEQEIFALAKKRVTIRRLAWAPGGVKPLRLRTVFALLASGVLRDDAVKDVSAEPALQAETGLFLLSVIQSRPDPSGMEAIRMEVRQELERSSHLDREQWLKVSRTAPREELVRAIDEKIDRYHSLLETVQGDQQLRTDIELILGRAASMLRLARQNPSRPVAAAPLPGASPSQTGSQPPAPSAASQTTTVAPATSHTVAFAPVTPSEPPAVPVAPGAESAGPSQMEIEHLLMEAEVRLTVSDYANAVRVLMKLVDLVPDQPALHARLAVAMACYPRTAKQAEREFLEATRLDPRNADYHYQFGLYYKTMRQRARAVVEMRAALGINPRHSGARTELEQLSPKDPLLSRLKKMTK